MTTYNIWNSEEKQKPFIEAPAFIISPFDQLPTDFRLYEQGADSGFIGQHIQKWAEVL